MRTTITLEPDAAELIRKAMRERRLTFKEAVNQAIVAGLTGAAGRPPAAWPTYDMGEPLVPIEQAIHLLDELDAGTAAVGTLGEGH
jgi:hypothetical protein